MISSKNSNFIFSDLHTTFNTREFLSTTADFYLRFNIVLMVNRSSFLGKTPPLPVIFPITTRSIICAPVAPTAHCHQLTNGNSWNGADLVRIFSSFSSFVVLIGNDWDLGSLLAVRGGLADYWTARGKLQTPARTAGMAGTTSVDNPPRKRKLIGQRNLPPRSARLGL